MQKTKPAKVKVTTAKKRKKKALGKGLSALIPEMEYFENQSPDYFQCGVDRISPNRYQPRMRFAENELDEPAESIRTQGVLQPLLVRRDGTGYELIAGERRLRAARKAGIQQVPVVVKDISESEMLEISIIENIQRENLNPMEEADAYHHLMTKFSMTQDRVAARVGKSRSAVANLLRLRQLPEPVKADIIDKTLSMGHARALLGADTPALLKGAWRAVVTKRLSVRETENLIKRMNREKQNPKAPEISSDKIYFDGIADELSRRFGTKVQIKRKGKRGKVEVDFYSDSDLDRILDFLKGT